MAPPGVVVAFPNAEMGPDKAKPTELLMTAGNPTAVDES